MPRFQTVVRHARFVYSPYTSDEMLGFGQLLADTIRARIESGQNIYDQAAAPLKPGRSGRRGYPDYKAARGLQPIRDWTWTGHTLRCLKVLNTNENRAVIGFLDEAMPGRSQTASQIAFWNNQRERQWGVSPRDQALERATTLLGGLVHDAAASVAQPSTQPWHTSGHRHRRTQPRKHPVPSFRPQFRPGRAPIPLRAGRGPAQLRSASQFEP
jgi:hypothetical protein